MFKKLFYLFNGIMAIATLITIVLAILNSIDPVKNLFNAKLSATDYFLDTVDRR